MKYFDVLYGPIHLDDIVEEILDRCWEVRRLKDVGMMNFRSITMHPLTRCSRLEHTLGVSYLAQRYADVNGLEPIKRRTLLAASLMHDISCSPFGHSVEWALVASGHAISHEEAAAWAANPKFSSASGGGPLFLDSPTFSPAAFGLDLQLFKHLQEGTPGHAQIKSDHMDLDNIDNVFRMAHYLGSDEAPRTSALKLVDALSMKPDEAIFSVAENSLEQAILWHRLRQDVYRAFIYDAEYLSFEGQIFELVEALLAMVDPKEIGSLAFFPDDVLLWNYFMDDAFADVRPLLRRLIANHAYQSIYIGRAESPVLCKALPSREEVNRLKRIFIENVLSDPRTLHSEGTLKTWARSLQTEQARFGPPIHLHVTTDKRKTARRIALTAVDRDGTSRPISIGEDRFFIVATLMTDITLNRLDREALVNCFKRSLQTWAGVDVEDIAPTVERPEQQQLSLQV